MAYARRTTRRVLAIVGVVLVLATVVSASRSWWRAKAPGPEVLAYFGELRAGTALDRWTLVRVFDVREGAIPVVMATKDGQRYQVDLLRRDDSGPAGVAVTNHLSLFLSNAGDGGVSTPEEQGLGIKALAAALRGREAAGAKPPRLSTMAERTSAPGDRQYDVPLE